MLINDIWPIKRKYYSTLTMLFINLGSILVLFIIQSMVSARPFHCWVDESSYEQASTVWLHPAKKWRFLPHSGRRSLSEGSKEPAAPGRIPQPAPETHLNVSHGRTLAKPLYVYRSLAILGLDVLSNMIYITSGVIIDVKCKYDWSFQAGERFNVVGLFSCYVTRAN